MAEMVRIEKVHKYFGNLHVLRDVSLKVERGSVVTIIGPSGSGKSTLLRCINYLEKIDSGEIWVDGKLVDPKVSNIRALRQEIGFVFQSFNLFPHLTAINNVALALRKVKRLSRAEALEMAEDSLARVGLDDKLDSYPDELSGGQQQRVAIARSLAMTPKLMLLDEITSALDPELIAEVLNVIQQVATGGMTMVIVTHEMGFAKEIANQIAFMCSGDILEMAPPKELLAQPQTKECEKFVKAVLQ